MVQNYEAVDESLSLATAFVAAGAAGVVSTLWQVHDFATALVVSKFYEGLFLAKSPPARALRQAQIWMRDADGTAIDAYVSHRAPLRALRAFHRPSIASGAPADYTAPSFWAAFVFNGA